MYPDQEHYQPKTYPNLEHTLERIRNGVSDLDDAAFLVLCDILHKACREAYAAADPHAQTMGAIIGSFASLLTLYDTEG